MLCVKSPSAGQTLLFCLFLSSLIITCKVWLLCGQSRRCLGWKRVPRLYDQHAARSFSSVLRQGIAKKYASDAWALRQHYMPVFITAAAKAAPDAMPLRQHRSDHGRRRSRSQLVMQAGRLGQPGGGDSARNEVRECVRHKILQTGKHVLVCPKERAGKGSSRRCCYLFCFTRQLRASWAVKMHWQGMPKRR